MPNESLVEYMVTDHWMSSVNDKTRIHLKDTSITITLASEQKGHKSATIRAMLASLNTIQRMFRYSDLLV